MKTINLCGVWSLSGSPEEGAGDRIDIEATVPGCVQLDLARQGYLPSDLYMGMNITETEKFEGYEWWYERTFTCPEEKERAFLVFEGVDCIAEYFLNGEKIGESDNMFIPHEFYVSPYLKTGENTLTVHLRSAVLYTHNQDHPACAMVNWGNNPANTGIRKAAHSFGWDIFPRVVTAGLWRGVRLELRDEVYFSQLYFDARTSSCTLLYGLECPWSELHGLSVEVEGECKNSRFYAKDIVRRAKYGHIEIAIPDPQLWWPYGYGEANVYDATVRILRGDEVIHEEKTSFGIRDVYLDRTDITDGKNGRFHFIINGVEIMCRGSNWVPVDAFHSRDAERYEKALLLVRDIGCNILRSWGGGVYEDHAFFDFCDRNGIMVWQDFSMACCIYPQTDDFKKTIEKEAVTIIRRLRNHPSIVLWAGDNEIDVMSLEFGARPSENKLSREVLPKAVHENDLTRPYLESSPYVSDIAYDKHDYSLLPEDHLWGPRDYFKSDYYKNSNAHFVSETGYHGCPSMNSIKKFITPDKCWDYKNNDEWILHSSDQAGNDARVMLMEEQIRQLFGSVPSDPDTYILASQISQAEAKKYFIERVRVGRPEKSGIIWWNLLDGWPQMSDAVVDYYYEKKLAYGYIKNSQAPFSIICGELSSRLYRLYACNDTLEERSGRFKVSDAITGELLLEDSFSAKANATTEIGALKEFYSTHRILAIEWTEGEHSGFNHYLCGFPPVSLETYTEFLNKYKEKL